MKGYFFIFVASVINVKMAYGNGYRFGPWNQWGICSRQGDNTEQSRTRQCRTAMCDGKHKEVRPCKMPSCCAGTPWNAWSPCSVTCGTGEHRRHRSCEKKGKLCSEHDTRTCLLRNCQTPDKYAKRYRPWSEWSPCNATCSHGITKRHRECLREKKPGTCREHQSKSCYDSSCAKNSAGIKEPIWNAWGPWGPCSEPCGGGRRSRTRTCQLDDRIHECSQKHKVGVCNEHPCIRKSVIWRDWSNWSECSTPCGPGNQRRIRTCQFRQSRRECSEGSQEEFRGCNNPCEAQWGSWGSWSSCDSTCGEGQALRNRQCLNERDSSTCFGNATQIKTCLLKVCRTFPQWTKWSPWRKCSSSCGPGEIIKTRLCMNGTAISNACRGGHVRRVSCRGNCSLENNWSEWSSCSQSCGTGFRRRTRICLAKRCVNPTGEENEECNVQKCGKGDYSQCGVAGDVRQILTGRQVARVVRGDNAARGAWPWQVMIVNKATNIRESLKTEFLGGGGSLVNNKYVLSASHMLGKDENNYIIILGLTVIPRKNEDIPRHIQVFSVEKFETHEKFDKDAYDYDIALIKLGSRMLFNNNGTFLNVKSPSSHVRFSKYVRPICLPCIHVHEGTKIYTINYGIKVQAYEEESCHIEEQKLISPKSAEGLAVVTGYGYITSRITHTEVSSRPEVLQQALLRMLDHGQCREGVEKIVETIAWEAANYTTRMICTKSASTTVISDACQGDSGGPLVRQVMRDDGSKHWVQVGIVSWGLGCATTLEVPGSTTRYQIPGYYTNVASLMFWIANILQI